MSKGLRQGLAILAGLTGGYVILSEIPFWSTRSSLAPVLTALAVGVVALAVLALGRGRNDVD